MSKRTEERMDLQELILCDKPVTCDRRPWGARRLPLGERPDEPRLRSSRRPPGPRDRETGHEIFRTDPPSAWRKFLIGPHIGGWRVLHRRLTRRAHFGIDRGRVPCLSEIRIVRHPTGP